LFDSIVQIAGFIGAPAIISGLLIRWLSHRLGTLDSRSEARRRENVLILHGLLKIGGLASATARAVKDGQANGSVTEALDEYAEYRESLSAFLVDQAATKSR
jgi:hypothetical protein